MTNWTTLTLGQIAEFINGGAWSQDEYTTEGIRVVRVSDVKDGTVDLSDCKYLAHSSVSRYRKNLLKTGDLIVCTVGSHPTQPGSVVGRAATVPRFADGTLLNQNAVCIRPLHPEIDSGWLGLLGKSKTFHQFIMGCARGAASQVRMPIGILKEMPVTYPPLELQRRIASILSAYDDLIENNTRRIAILEEMARRIYEEWFVRFRFPGHENVRMVESELGPVPEGWKVAPLIDLCASVEDGDWIETKDQGGSDFRLLQISNVGLNAFVETDNFRYVSAETFRRLRCREVQPGQILVARMPKPIGRAWLVTPQPWRMITAVDVAIVDPDGSLTSAEYLLHFLNSDATLASFASQASGTTRLRITRKQIAAMPLCAPPVHFAHQFRDLVGPMNDQIALLVRKNANLRITRDLLLPKLISGELDVSVLPEPERAAA